MADAGEYSFTAYQDDGDGVAEIGIGGDDTIITYTLLTDANGMVLFENVDTNIPILDNKGAPTGLFKATYWITETQEDFTQGTYEFDQGVIVSSGTPSGFTGEVAKVTVVEGTGTAVRNAEVIFRNSPPDNQPPTINLEKTVNPLSISEGSTGPVTYTYVLTNTDPTPSIDPDPLTINTLVDDNGTPDTGNTADDFYLVQGVVLQSGVTLNKTGGDQDNLLEVGETWTYTVSRLVPSQNAGTSHTNIATVSAVDDEGTAATDADDATVTFTDVLPDITIDKSANVSSVAETGGNVTFTFVINNLNGEEVTLTSIEDDKFTSDDLLAAAVAANGNSDVLAGGGSVTFQITKFLTGDDLVAHVNTVTAIAVDDDNNSDTATDDATVTFDDVLPDITIDKSANVSSVAETGGNVTFTFVINNLNGEEVTLTSIEDDKFTSDDLLAAAVAANGNSDVLAGGGSVTFQITKFLTGDDLVAHVNTVIAIAVDDDNNSDTAMDDATVTFDDVLPDITVLKNPSVTAVPETGANVTFTCDVTNNSTETANLDSLTDSDFGNLVTLGVFDSKITLAPGASISSTYTTFISGNYESGISHNNVFTATASDNDGNSDIATDDATVSFTDVTAQIDVEKYVWDGDSWEDADMASGPILNQGTNPQFKFVVTNTGTGVLSNVTLTDSDFNIDTTSGDKIYEIGNLAVNGSKELIFTAPWTAGQHTNTATAYGSFTDGAGNIESATDSDDANYFGECPPCEFDIFESFSGPNINVTIKLGRVIN